MTRPLSSLKLTLVEDRRGNSAPATPVPVRRYRLARLRFADQPLPSEKRSDYLKRTYD